MANNNWMGIIAIIIGLVLLISPTMGITAISIISGLLLAGLGIWMIINAIKQRKTNQAAAIVWLVFSLIALIIGVSLIFQLFSIGTLAGIWLYVTGVLLIIAGILILASTKDSSYKNKIGIVGIVLGLIYIIIGAIALNPIYLGIILGLIFVGYGILSLRDII